MVKRISLANFLERLATVGVSGEDWQHHLVTHYAEAELEEVRRAIVKLMLNSSFDESEHHLRRLKLQPNNLELRRQIQLIAANLVSPGQGIKRLIKEEWWLDWHISLNEKFVDVSWARLQVLDDLSAEIFDMDGRTIYCENEESAAIDLLEDEYRQFANLDGEDEQELGICLNSLQPPNVNSKEDLQPLMSLRFQRQL